jgi:hypothetical protein
MSEQQPVVVSGTFAVAGSTWREIQLDVAGMSPAQIAVALEEQADGVSLCHQCGPECEDPELDGLTSMNVAGVEYVRDDTGAWVEYRR